MTTVHDVIGPQLERYYRDDLTRRHLAPPLAMLERSLGRELELGPEAERFLRWFIDWDGPTFEGLSALIDAVVIDVGNQR